MQFVWIGVGVLTPENRELVEKYELGRRVLLPIVAHWRIIHGFRSKSLNFAVISV